MWRAVVVVVIIVVVCINVVVVVIIVIVVVIVLYYISGFIIICTIVATVVLICCIVLSCDVLWSGVNVYKCAVCDVVVVDRLGVIDSLLGCVVLLCGWVWCRDICCVVYSRAVCEVVDID